jgi:hypothetical protein
MAARRHGGPCNVRRTSAALLQAFATQAADALASASASFVATNSSQQSVRQQLLASTLAVAVAPQPHVVPPPPFHALPPPPLVLADAEDDAPFGRNAPRFSGCCGRPRLGHTLTAGKCLLQPLPGHVGSQLHKRWAAREEKKAKPG